MAKTLFPMFGNDFEGDSVQEPTLPVAKECAWDFDADRPIFQNGNPVPVIGLDAVKVWAYQALLTARRRYEVWSPSFGNDLDRLVGQSFSSEAKKAEASRYISDCLLVSPYIKEVDVQNMQLDVDRFTAVVHLITIYGEEDIYV